MCLCLARTAEAVPRPTEYWVDASATVDGNGTVRKPFRSLQSALNVKSSGARRIHIRRGSYEGPLQLMNGDSLEGEGQVLIFSDSEPQQLVSVSGSVSMSNLTLSGGQRSIFVEGDAHLSNVTLAAFRKTGIAVSGRLKMRNSEIQGTLSETVGVFAQASSQVSIDGVLFSGALRRAVETQGSRVEVLNSSFEGPSTALHQRGGNMHIENCGISQGRGPAIFGAGGKLSVKGVRVSGHEYGLQTGQGSEFTVNDFVSLRAQRAAVALTGSSGRLSDSIILEAGNFGGVQLIESQVTVERLRIHRALASGLFVRQGSINATDVVIANVISEENSGTKSGGDGIQLYGGSHRLSAVQVLNIEGSGLLSSMYAQTELVDFSCTRCGWGGVVTEQHASLRARSVFVENSMVAVSVPDDAEAFVVNLISMKNREGPFWVECSKGSRLSVKGLKTDTPAAFASCVYP